MAKKEAVPTCVVVLGMHRSGTSLASSLLEALGVNMGERFSPPNATNPYGYYEDLDFYDMNVRILETAGGCWHDPPTRHEIVWAGAQLVSDVVDLLDRKSQSDLWGWKEPRTVLTWPVYEPFLAGDVRFVRTVRRREHVRASLINRHRGTCDNWDALITHYESLIDSYLRVVPTSHVYRVVFEEVISREHAPAVVRGLARFVGVDADIDPALDRIHYRG